jgi:ParB family chromosome partitioning protein
MPTLAKPRSRKAPPAAATNGHAAPPLRIMKQAVEAANLDVSKIDPSPYQPRQSFPESEIQELAQTIVNQGQLTPIVVREKGSRWELVDGERRLRAVKAIGYDHIRAEIHDLSDADARAIVLVSALQRKELNAIEEALAFKTSLDAGDAPGPTELARQLGLSQGHVSNRLRLLELPEAIRKRVISREIPPTHARELVPFKEHPKILEAIVKDALAGDGIEGLDEFRRTIRREVRNETEGLAGQRYDYKQGRAFKHFTPTEEQRAQLGIITIEGHDGKPEQRATNKKLWNNLQAAYEREVLAKEAKKGKPDKKAKPPKPEDLTPAQRKQLEAEERKRKAEQAKQFAKRLYEWKISWLQYMIAREIPLVSQERLMAMLCLAAADWGLGGMGTREWLAAAITATGGQLKKSKRHFGKDLCGAMAELPAPDRVAADLLARCFWDEKQGPRTCVDDDDVETIADEFLGIDLADRWADEQAGPLSEAYWNLHTKEQLQDLAAELKVSLPPGCKKSEAVAAFLARMPSPDDSTNEDADKWLTLPKEIRQAKRPK